MGGFVTSRMRTSLPCTAASGNTDTDTEMERTIPIPGYLHGREDIDEAEAPFCTAVNPKFDVESWDFYGAPEDMLQLRAGRNSGGL